MILQQPLIILGDKVLQYISSFGPKRKCGNKTKILGIRYSFLKKGDPVIYFSIWRRKLQYLFCFIISANIVIPNCQLQEGLGRHFISYHAGKLFAIYGSIACQIFL